MLFRRPCLLRVIAPGLCIVLFASGGAPFSAADGGPPPAGKVGVPDPELQAAINKAIDKGAQWLHGQQQPSGGIGGGVVTRQGGQAHYEIGVTALAGLALLAAGDKRGDKPVDDVMAYLRAQDALFGEAGSRSTYDTGILLMFITAYYRGHEAKVTGSTRPGRSRNPCNLPPEAMKWVQELANWLVSVRKPLTCTWGYPQNRDDHSNTQYAFLGLRAARDCGAFIPPQVFFTAVKTMIDRQEKEGPKRLRIIPSPDPKASPYAIDAGDRARGWSYLQQPFLATGSMTTSGIAVVAICNDALLHPQRLGTYTPALEHQAERAAQDGFSWLDKNWSVERNPPSGAPNWHYYYLYGLERACVLGGRDLIGQHDWYVEGARYLVGKQRGDGRWSTGMLGEGTYEASDIVDTAWAILFLARATRPMPPIRAPVVTPGG